MIGGSQCARLGAEICPSLSSVAVINIMMGSNLERQRFIWVIHLDGRPSLMEARIGTQAETEAGTMRKTLFCDFLSMACSVCFHISKDQMPQRAPSTMD